MAHLKTDNFKMVYNQLCMILHLAIKAHLSVNY